MREIGGKKRRAKGTRSKDRIKVEIPREGGERGRGGSAYGWKESKRTKRTTTRSNAVRREFRREVTSVRKERDTKEAGKTPTGFVNQKISRHASGLITSEEWRKRGSVKGLVGGPGGRELCRWRLGFLYTRLNRTDKE